MINTKVKLKPTLAKWHLNHPDIFVCDPLHPIPKKYEPELLIHLACCLGEPVYGTVIGNGSSKNCWLVKWKIGDLSTQYYVDRHHFDVTKLYKLIK